MDEDEIYREHFPWTGKGKRERVYITYGDLQRIIEDFSSSAGALAEFRLFAAICKDNPDSPATTDAFSHQLQEAIARQVPGSRNGFEAVLEVSVLEELLRREGVQIDWGGN